MYTTTLQITLIGAWLQPHVLHKGLHYSCCAELWPLQCGKETLTFSDQGLPDRDIQSRRRVSGIEQVLLSWRLPAFHVSW